MSSFVALSVAVGCSSGGVDLSHGNPNVPPATGATTAPPGGPTTAPTTAPTTGPTAPPTAPPTPVPTGTPTAVPLACSAPTATIPGTYTSIISQGSIASGTYTQSSATGSGLWQAVTYTAATPTPVPTPTPTPVPTATPTNTPIPTPTPVTYVFYSGVYSVAGFAGTGVGGAFTASATQGCFTLLTRADGMSISPPSPNNASLFGSPNLPAGVNPALAGTGAIARFTITGIGPTSGTGTFALDNGAAGTATVQSSRTITAGNVRRVLDRYRGF